MSARANHSRTTATVTRSARANQALSGTRRARVRHSFVRPPGMPESVEPGAEAWLGRLTRLATPTGLEPATSAVTGRRANQLRYGAS